MCIVGDAEHRLLFCSSGEQLEHRQADAKAIRWRAAAKSKGCVECASEGRREVGYAVDERTTELLQAGVRQVHLRLHTRHAGYEKVVRERTCDIEQFGLADTGVPTKDQCGASAVTGSVEHSSENAEFTLSTDQAGRSGDAVP
jgi:hypothetical protein